MSKVHRHLFQSLAVALKEIIEGGKSPGPVLERLFKANPKWGSRDRKFFAEQSYELIRWWRRDWSLLGQEPSFSVEDIIQLWGAHQRFLENELPDWPEFKNLPKLKEPALSAVMHSLPDWIFEKGHRQFGAAWEEMLPFLNTPAPVDIRWNPLKTNKEKLQKALAQLDLQSVEITDLPSGLELESRKKLTNSEPFLAGHFEFQDRSSQLIAPFLQPMPGEKIIDLCAGAGGKSLHIATLMKNRGEVLACDIVPEKLSELEKRAKRNGITIIQTKLNQSDFTRAAADRVLLDVPCSGLGVLRRNPHSKWLMTEEKIEALKKTQRQLLLQAESLVKPDGVLVYATCSFLAEEDEEQITWFLQDAGRNWKVDAQMRINPGPAIGDSFYAVRLVKK
jgi:16S rRNA (cytosine967-C5)-methyltransferase